MVGWDWIGLDDNDDDDDRAHMIKRKSDKKTVVVLLLLWVKIISICLIECSGKVVEEERE